MAISLDLEAMAQENSYPGVRVGWACGPGVGRLAGVEGRKIFAYHTIPYHTYGNKANGRKLGSQAMAQDIRRC